MKRCTHCDALKSEGEFYKQPGTFDGLMGKCKQCHRELMKRNRRDNPMVQQRDRERAKLPHRRAKAKRDVANWRRKYPDKYAALTALHNAIRDKKIKRGRACIDCGARNNVYGIHPDYSKPLEVTWRCALCHHRGRFAATPADVARSSQQSG